MFRLLRWCLPTQAMSSALAKMGQQHRPLYFDMVLLVRKVHRVKPVRRVHKVRKETREPLVLRVHREIQGLLVPKDHKVIRVSKVRKEIREPQVLLEHRVFRVNQDLRVFLLK